jgi:hypothetical protein
MVLGVAVLGIGSGVGSTRANAQGPRSTTAARVNPITQPYMNPYNNPYLNPALSAGTTSRNDAMLYLWAAQQQPGGLMGPRSTESASVRPAEMPRSAMQPGGGASRYFNRRPSSGETAESS